MKISWSKSFRVGEFDTNWKSMPSTSGVYIIRKSQSVKRIGGIDTTGILYFGKTTNIRRRMWQFLKAHHVASGFLWTHSQIAGLVLGTDIRSVSEIEKNLTKLTVRYATPIPLLKLASAERALLFSYINTFGEAPPLNLSLSKRWDSMPSSFDLRWAEIGIFERA